MYKYLSLFIGVLMSISSFGQSSKKNESFGITLSLPIINYSYYSFAEAKGKEGLIGIGGAIYYKHNRFKYSLNGAIETSDFLEYFVSDVGKYVNMNFIEGLVHYNIYKKLNIIGGVNCSTYDFINGGMGIDNTPGSLYSNHVINDKTIGLTFGTELAFTQNFSIAAFYRPSIYCFDKKSFKQMISLDFRFDINLRKRK